ncbi:MAG: hypothetical protein FJW14_06270 [Acidimicrobiia bacterium]|nr:hypothetical protein [Acidimicrobiia bacterium]
MSDVWTSIALIYVAGVVWGLLVIDARVGVRMGLAVLWPVGPAAFLVTLTILLAASLIAFPMFGLAVAAIAGLVSWIATR